MLLLPESPRVHDAFFHPLVGLAASSPHAYPCPEFSDEAWLRLNLQRVLEASVSGRAFLQEHGPRFDCPPGRANYFKSLHSERRRDLARDVNLRVLALAAAVAGGLPDHLDHLSELTDYDCFALDAHWHQAAAHDARHDGAKMAVGHLYSLNLRTHGLQHLAAAEGLHEHDMSMLKRLKPAGLRHAVPKGRRVLLIYDRAGIGFDYWKRCRHERAVYFISRVKEGMIFDWISDRPLDPKHPSITADREVMTREGHPLRIVYYTDPVSGEAYQFLTNEMDLPARVIAELYRRRWDVEKVFDEIKNKLGQKKAWATSLVAKAAQGHLVALTHNLLTIYHTRLERAHGVINQAEDQRRAQRQAEQEETAREAGRPTTPLGTGVRRATQHSVKFLRWLRCVLQENLAEATAVRRLTLLYASS